MRFEELIEKIGMTDRTKWTVWSGKDVAERVGNQGKYYEPGCKAFERVLANLKSRYESGEYDWADWDEDCFQLSYHTPSVKNLCYTVYW